MREKRKCKELQYVNTEFFLFTFSSVMFSFIISDRYHFNLQKGLLKQLSVMYLVR